MLTMAVRRELFVLDAPSNLGLRPPEEGVIPGCYKLPWALRDRGLLKLLGAADAGCLLPPRYESRWTAGDGDRNAPGVAAYSMALADRLDTLAVPNRQVLVLGGDCSILIGHMLALRRRGRYGLVFVDAHSDFRHPGNAPPIVAAAGEDLAIVTGRGDRRLIDLEGRRPYVRDQDVHVVGVRDSDSHLAELASLGMRVTTSAQARAQLGPLLTRTVLQTVTANTDGFWIHLDLDVIDSAEMPAVDCPEPDGLPATTLSAVLAPLLAAPECVGMEVTIYDPDRDPAGACADRIVACLAQAFERSA